jgi:CheY-like chemotaxis protein
MKSKPLVLIVEDDPDWMDEICEILSEYALVKASSVKEANRIISEQPLNLLVLDLGLSDTTGVMSGLAILDSIKSKALNLPCVVVTSRDFSIIVANELFKHYQIFDGLRKPDDINRLSSVAALALEKNQRPYGPIKVLFLSATPEDMVRLEVDKEYKAIDEAIRKSDVRDRYEIRYNPATKVSEVQGVLLRFRPNIVHFSGHGSNRKELILLDDDGAVHPVSTSALEGLFDLVNKDKNIKCVILNACYSSSQAKAIANHIECVIGMSDEITDQAAINFSTSFYQGLGYGNDIKTSFDLGRNQLSLVASGEHNTPKLIVKKDAILGKIFFI